MKVVCVTILQRAGARLGRGEWQRLWQILRFVGGMSETARAQAKYPQLLTNRSFPVYSDTMFESCTGRRIASLHLGLNVNKHLGQASSLSFNLLFRMVNHPPSWSMRNFR